MNRAVAFYQSSIGKKAVMAVTGIIGVGFVIGHMLGNLQAFPMLGGKEGLNNYSEFLRQTHGLLWLARSVLLTAVLLHIVAAYQLTRMSWAGRPTDYKYWYPEGSDYASRTMRWSGPILALFIIYHLLDLTFGPVNPDFVEGDVFHNLVVSFSYWNISLVYIVAMLALGLHMYHGAWSMFQSLGLNNSKYDTLLKRFAILVTVFVVAGNISIPLGVLIGIIHE